jgi:hypothetical protein
MSDGVRLTADVVDVIDGGCGLALMTRLKSGSTEVVRGKLTGNQNTEQLQAAVRWCVAGPGGTFRAGLEFLGGHSTQNHRATQNHPDTLDCYEVMQLSPHADAETIARVYRMLAFRYHPDNRETGNSEKFIRLSEAYRILGDPEKRARYDARRDAMRRRSEAAFAQATLVNASKEDGQKRIDRVTAEAKSSDRSGRANEISPFVGTLRGWNAALRYPRL